MEKYKRLFSNSIIFAIGNFGSKILLLLLVPLYTFYLSQSDYGISDLITTTTNMLLPIVSLSVYEGTLRFVMEKKCTEDQYDVLKTSFRALMLPAFLFIVAIVIINNWISEIPYYQYIIIIVFLQSIQNILTQYARGIERIKLYAVNGIFFTFVLSMSNIVLIVYLSQGIMGYINSVIISTILSIFFLLSQLNLNIWKILKLKDNINLRKKLLTYSIPLIPNSFMWWLMNASSRYFILFFYGSAENGLYAVASKIPSILSMIQTIFFQAWQLSAIEEYGSKDKEQFYSKVFDGLFMVLIAGTSLFLVILKPLLKYTVENSYFISWKYVPFLLLGIVFSSFSSFYGTIYLASKKTKGMMSSSIAGGIVSLLINFVAIPYMGVIGASFSTMLSFFLMWIYRVFDTRSYMKIELYKTKMIFSFILIGIQIGIVFIGISYEILINMI